MLDTPSHQTITLTSILSLLIVDFCGSSASHLLPCFVVSDLVHAPPSQLSGILDRESTPFVGKDVTAAADSVADRC